MRMRCFKVLWAVGLLACLSAPVLAADRVALVVGNADYVEAAARLRNPVNDATGVAAALRRLGFEVIEGRNLDREGFFDKIVAFDDAARSAEMALFFYAGHGLQVNGRNYLGPVDMKLERRQDLSRRAIELAEVMEVMRSDTNLVILDACRNNPLAEELARSLGLSREVAASRGLAQVESTGEMLIAYATAPDDVAADGTGDHSPYTAALLEHIETPGLSVQELFTEVTGEVKRRTGGKQQPWTNSSLSKVIRLVPVSDSGPTVPPDDTSPADETNETASGRLAAERLAAEREYWRTVKDSQDPADLRAYLEQYREGTYRALAQNRLRDLVERRLAAVDAGNLREYLGRELSPTAVGEHGWTDLHYAAASNLPDVVEALLDAGADIGAGTTLAEDGETGLSDALHQFIVSLGFEVGFWFGPSPGQGITPLHVAAWGNARDAALVLIEHGDVEQKDESECTPLHWAAFGNARNVALELIARGADVNAKSDYGNTPLHWAASSNAREMALELIARGADVNAKDGYSSTPLHYAAIKDALETLLELIAHGADIDAKRNNGGTPLYLATWDGSWKTALALIEHGADVRAATGGGAPLHLAARRNAREVVLALIERGADVLAMDHNGDTPLHLAAGRNAREIASALIERGADVDARNDEGKTPWDVATEESAQGVLSVLRKQSAED